MAYMSPTDLHASSTVKTHAVPTDLEPWWLHADCRFFGAALFFAPEHETPAQRIRRERDAKRICGPCPVRAQCLECALSIGETYGIWGGTTERERAGSPNRRWKNKPG